VGAKKLPKGRILMMMMIIMMLVYWLSSLYRIAFVDFSALYIG